MPPATTITSREVQPVPLVLVVENEAILRASMVRGLTRLDGIDIVDAGTVSEGMEILDALSPDLLVTDLNLPDGSGTQLISEIQRRDLPTAIIVISAYVDSYQHELSAWSRVDIREKPFPLNQLRSLVMERLRAQISATDVAQPFTVSDYIQLACMGQKSVAITVSGDHARSGQIIVCRGELWTAQDRDGDGEQALRRLLAVSDARILVVAAPQASAVERTLTGGWQNLLLEAARLEDEDRAQDSDYAALDVITDEPGGAEDPWADLFSDADADANAADDDDPGDGIDGEAPGIGVGDRLPAAQARDVRSSAFGELVERAVDALLRKDYQRACRAFADAAALDPGDAMVNGNLERLRILGYHAP